LILKRLIFFEKIIEWIWLINEKQERENNVLVYGEIT